MSIGSQQIKFEPLVKKEKNSNKSIVALKKPTISIYQDKDGGWHCDIDVYGYVYGAIRHSRQEIESFAIRQTVVQLDRGIELVLVKF